MLRWSIISDRFRTGCAHKFWLDFAVLLSGKLRDKARIMAFLDAGMDVMRLNMSHGDHTFHAETIEILRECCAETKRSEKPFRFGATSSDNADRYFLSPAMQSLHRTGKR